MSSIPQIPNPFIYALVVGVIYGSVFCTSTCLPYIASYIAGIGADFRKGLLVTLIYSLGRVTAYAVIGGLIAISSGIFKFAVGESSFSAFQSYAPYGFALVTIVIGLNILLNIPSPSCQCTIKDKKNLELKRDKGPFDFRAFSLGFSRGLIVCPYLGMLLLYSIPFGVPMDSFTLAVLFGLGTTLSPMLLLGGVTGWLLNKATYLKKWISLAGGVILIVLGIITLVNTIFVPSL